MFSLSGFKIMLDPVCVNSNSDVEPPFYLALFCLYFRKSNGCFLADKNNS